MGEEGQGFQEHSGFEWQPQRHRKKADTETPDAGILAADANATDACAPFTALNECLATLHASHNLGVEFNCLRAKVTGVHTNADLSGCKGSIGDKAEGLHKAIHELNPSADAKGGARTPSSRPRTTSRISARRRKTEIAQRLKGFLRAG